DCLAVVDNDELKRRRPAEIKREVCYSGAIRFYRVSSGQRGVRNHSVDGLGATACQAALSVRNKTAYVRVGSCVRGDSVHDEPVSATQTCVRAGRKSLLSLLLCHAHGGSPDKECQQRDEVARYVREVDHSSLQIVIRFSSSSLVNKQLRRP